MGCFDWAQILCGNVSRVEEHLLQISCDLHTRFGRCFRTEVGGGLVVHVRGTFGALWHCQRGPLEFLAKFCMVGAWVQ